MTGVWKLIIGLVGGLIVTSTAFASIMPVSAGVAGRQFSDVRSEKGCQNQSAYSRFCSPSLDDLGSSSLDFSTEESETCGQTEQTQPLLRLTDATTNSFDLCVYALLGLGICRTGPWIKRFSFGSVPEWFHDGGPLQIGHSHAVMPKTLCSASACCFVQPDGQPDDRLPRLSRWAVSPLLRKSLFTPCVLAARGPPKNEQLA